MNAIFASASLALRSRARAFAYWVATVVLLALIMPFSVAAQTAPIPEGSLVRTADDATVFLIDGGKRRPVESADAFSHQGLQWGEILMVTADRLNAHPLGDLINAKDELVLADEAEVLPDLLPFAAEDIRLEQSGGRIQLKYTAAFWNRGKAPLELITVSGIRNVDGEFPAYQRIIRRNGMRRDRPVGTLFWHNVHGHYHYGDFANYVLEKIGADGKVTGTSTTTQKTTFCMRDDRSVTIPPEGKRAPRTYSGCGGMRQGVSVGWADVYPYTLPDQFIEVTTLESGRYRLSFDVDPQHHFSEASRDNNRSSAFIDYDAENVTVSVVARASPHAVANNSYPNGAVLRAPGNATLYAIRDGKRRQLRSAAAIAAYGTPAGVFEVPQAAIDGLPRTMLVRVAGTAAVYLINEQNYYRKILNPEVFASYGFSMADVADISAAEFATYAPNDLIMRAGDNRVYSVSTKKLVGSYASLPSQGKSLASVQLVNVTDFNAYAVSIVANGLIVPWDIVFLPDGDMLVTERPGTLRRIGKNPAQIDLPAVLHVGEGGLMGIALHPDFAQNNFVYLYFTTSDEGGRSNRVSRFRLDGDRLVEEKVIVDGIAAALYHDGGQIAFGPDGMLYVTTGDAESPALAQDKGSLSGKTLRLTADGAVPADNPFGTPVWSWGHRNAQGIAWDASGRMWQTEHGRSGALSGYDELNRVEKGKNYGWPTIQGPETATGMETPVRNSGPTTTWAPSGLAYLDGVLYFAGLKGASLYAATLNDLGGISDFSAFLTDTYGRLRAVVPGPDGALYVTTSNRDGRGTVRAGDDKILRVFPGMLR